MKDTNDNWARRQVAQHGVDRYPTPERQCLKLVEEVGELAKEINRAEQRIYRIRSEAADVALALYGLCDKLDIDLDAEIRIVVRGDKRKFT